LLTVNLILVSLLNSKRKAATTSRKLLTTIAAKPSNLEDCETETTNCETTTTKFNNVAVHPSKKEYARWANRLADEIQKLLA
jgi:lysophospholipase L1-like esterase